VLARAATVLADDLAAMIGARDEPEVARFHRRVIERARHHEATVFRGGNARIARMDAAVANAVAADWLELDEGYRPRPAMPASISCRHCWLRRDRGPFLRRKSCAAFS
jgi:2-methylcitrate dehydratase PrpD